MLQALRYIVSDLKRTMRVDPAEFTEPGEDSPAIDVRLCIDHLDRKHPSWTFRTGSVDYDPYHSEYCGASCVTPDTDAEELLSELISQIDNYDGAPYCSYCGSMKRCDCPPRAEND
jgi:hypothetical protein